MASLGSVPYPPVWDRRKAPVFAGNPSEQEPASWVTPNGNLAEVVPGIALQIARQSEINDAIWHAYPVLFATLPAAFRTLFSPWYQITPVMVELTNGAIWPLKSDPHLNRSRSVVPQSVSVQAGCSSCRIHCSMNVPPTNVPTSPIGTPASAGSSASA